VLLESCRQTGTEAAVRVCRHVTACQIRACMHHPAGLAPRLPFQVAGLVALLGCQVWRRLGSDDDAPLLAQLGQVRAKMVLIS